MKICGKREFELLQKIGFVRMGGTEEELKAAKILMEEIRKKNVSATAEITIEVNPGTVTMEKLKDYRNAGKII